jgi:hypothetical protein
VYTPKDLDFLDNISDQASVAIARVQTVIDLQRRVQEMNALTRVSQGVNVTLTFDDVLELIFAQATLIIPSSLFHITLYSKAANYFYYGFCVDEHERITSRENRPLPASFGLGQRSSAGRPILTQDYMRNARRAIRSSSRAMPDGCRSMPGLRRWDPGVGSACHIDLHAHSSTVAGHADQTVGAIVSPLVAGDRTAPHQLSTLNEITASLLQWSRSLCFKIFWKMPSAF